MQTIRLRHEVLTDEVNKAFLQLCQQFTVVRQARAKQELEVTHQRYLGYIELHDAFAMELGGMMAREASYSEGEALFDYTFRPAQDQRLFELRLELDGKLIDILWSAGWEESALITLREGLRERAAMEQGRRVEIMAYTESLLRHNDEINTEIGYGHFAAANRRLSEILQELRDKCAQLALEANCTPVADA